MSSPTRTALLVMPFLCSKTGPRAWSRLATHTVGCNPGGIHSPLLLDLHNLLHKSLILINDHGGVDARKQRLP